MADARARWSWLGPLLGIGVLAWVNLQIQPWTLDDAYISFRYAENLAAGVGPVYNPGERVEGYTTPLWVGLLAVGHALGGDTRALSKVLGLGFAIGTLVLLGQAHRFHAELSREAGARAALLTGSTAVFGVWAMPGMEVPLVAFLLTLTALASVRDGVDGRGWVLAGVAGALALGSRPDSVVVVGVFAGLAAWRAVRAREVSPLRAPALTAALFGPYFLVRWAWYGWLLPNTFYAKVGATGAQLERGVAYLGDGGLALAPLVAGGALFVGCLAVGFRPARAAAGVGVALVAHVLYVLSVGGDVMPGFRFLAGVVPLGALLAAIGWGRLPGWLAHLGVGASVVVGVWTLQAHPDLAPRIARGVVGRNGEEVGLWLRANVPPDLLLATNTAGSVPYYSRLHTVDMLGLNDAHIAHSEAPRMGAGKAGHEKADGAYVFGRDPDLVQLGSARGSVKPLFRSDRELVRQPGFDERYVLQRYTLPSKAELVLYVRRSLVEAGVTPPSR